MFLQVKVKQNKKGIESHTLLLLNSDQFGACAISSQDLFPIDFLEGILYIIGRIWQDIFPAWSWDDATGIWSVWLSFCNEKDVQY